jgi:L-fucose isomerase
MALIARDLMVGNPKLKPKWASARRPSATTPSPAASRASASGPTTCPTATSWRRSSPPPSTGTASAPPYIVATENDALNGISMLFGHLLTGTAQIFADVRTYWSPDAVKRVTGYKLEGGRRRHPAPDQLRPAALDGTGQQKRGGEPAMKPYWEITAEEAKPAWSHHLARQRSRNTSAAAAGRRASAPGRHAGHHVPRQPGARAGPGLADRRRLDRRPARPVHDDLDQRTNPTWPTTWFARAPHRQGAFRDVYTVMNNWGANHGAISYGHIGAD